MNSIRHLFLFFSCISLCFSTGRAVQCGDPAPPLLSVADFNADGIVNGEDISKIGQAVSGPYLSLYDRNGDHVLDQLDVVISAQEMGSYSTPADQLLAQVWLANAHIATATGDELVDDDWLPYMTSFAGHGMHWAKASTLAVTVGGGARNYSLFSPVGINIELDSADRVAAFFYGDQADALFDCYGNGTACESDYGNGQPTGFAWTNQRILEFSDSPPSYPGSPPGGWHTHPGLCFTWTTNDTTLLKQGIGQLTYDHTTFNECQALPSVLKVPAGPFGLINPWTRGIWMYHLWLFRLNPHGLYARHHPCIDQNRPHIVNLHIINPIPDFFMHEY